MRQLHGYVTKKMAEVKESRSDKFRRLAVSRMNVTLKQLRLIKNLANRNNYEWTDAEAEKIVSALRKAVDGIEKRFKQSSSETDKPFEL